MPFRHARPTVINVSLRRNPPNLVLKIRDNGSGIADGRSGGEGFGFANMRARAKNIGAGLAGFYAHLAQIRNCLGVTPTIRLK